MSRNKDLYRGVSIITCTNRAQFFKNIVSNFNRQRYSLKELVIILNKDSMRLDEYRKKVQAFNNISVYKVPERVTLGACLNYAVGKTKYPCITKFDDDDYYAQNYLLEQIKALQSTGADIVGKRAYLVYLEKKKLLIMRFPKQQRQFVRLVQGPTITFKRRVFRRVRFANVSLGEDVSFLRRCRAKGYKIYATTPYNFVYIRRKNKQSHTWKAKEHYLMSGSRIIAKTTRYRKFASRNL